MVSMKERVWDKKPVDAQSGQKVLNFIVEERTVTLEAIVERFPWLRWGDLFSIVWRFRREGLVTIHQVDAQMEIRMREQACHAV